MRRVFEYVAPAWVGWIGSLLCVASLATLLLTEASPGWLGLLGFVMVAAAFDPARWRS
jgi:hypothetical protein